MNEQITKSAKSAVNPLRAWLAEFLLTRGLARPSGKPLFSYNVTDTELRQMSALLRNHANALQSSATMTPLAAIFCLYVAERFRREYDGTEGWSWQGFEHALGQGLNPEKRSQILIDGLERYWKRPIRLRERGRDLLGSLFLEGGLPWPLLQSDTHGFGRVVRRALRQYFHARINRQTALDLVNDSQGDLPQTFRNQESLGILAGIIEQLMYLAEHYNLNEQQDPVQYLDQQAPGWRSPFPLPLDEQNAHSLINEWLRDAGKRRAERLADENKLQAYSCQHLLRGNLDDWRLESSVQLPDCERFEVDLSSLTTSRLELGFFEGDLLLLRAGSVFAKVDETHKQLDVRFSRTEFTLERHEHHKPLFLRLLANGSTIFSAAISDSAIDDEQHPMIFLEQDADLVMVANASCRLQSPTYVVRIPRDATLTPATEDIENLACDNRGGTWFRSRTKLQVRSDEGMFTIQPAADAAATVPLRLTGHQSLFDGNPSMIYLGWPKLEIPDGYPFASNELNIYINGKQVNQGRDSLYAGPVRYQVRGPNQEVLLNRRFTVLSRELEISLSAQHGDKPAILAVRGFSDSLPQLKHPDLVIKQLPKNGGHSFELVPRGERYPATVELQLVNTITHDVSVLRLPFPYIGARLLDADLQPSNRRQMLLDELAGLRIALTSVVEGSPLFELIMSVPGQGKLPQLHRKIHVGRTPVLLNLFSLTAEIEQLLSASDDQDAYVQLEVRNQRSLLTLEIRRFDGEIVPQTPNCWSIQCRASLESSALAIAEAMLIADPKRRVVTLPQRRSQGVGTGIFEASNEMQEDGPWLIYPGANSKVRFRPKIFNPKHIDERYIKEKSRSLHEACRQFHPSQNPHAISAVVAEMADNFNHSGWQYLSDLKSSFFHLPLSTFQAWRELAQNIEALAFAVFRLELDEPFCHRIRNELAVLWDNIPLTVWVIVYRKFCEGLEQQGNSPALFSVRASQRSMVLRSVISGFDHLNGYLESGETGKLIKAPIELILPTWYQQLRHRHADDDHWPTLLRGPLIKWFSQNPILSRFRSLSKVEYTDAVTLLPIFMAAVSAGFATLDQLETSATHRNYAIRLLADYDRMDWYQPVHAMVVCWLLTQNITR